MGGTTTNIITYKQKNNVNSDKNGSNGTATRWDETGAHSISQAGLRLMAILLPSPTPYPVSVTLSTQIIAAVRIQRTLHSLRVSGCSDIAIVHS